MAYITDVENSVAALLAHLGREVVQGQIGESGVPSKPYAIWNTKMIEFGDSIRNETTDARQKIIAANTPIDILIDIVGGNAMLDATKFCLSLRESQRTLDLYKYCGLSGVSQINNLSAVETGKFRDRVQFTLSLFTVIDLINEPEQIESIGLLVRSSIPPFEKLIIVPYGECN